MKTYELQKAGIDNLVRVDRPRPEPRKGQVLVRMRAGSLNYRDLLVAERRQEGFPLVPLSDGAGEVAAVGEGVTRVKVGDRVAGTFFQSWVDGELTPEARETALGGSINGVLSEYVVLREDGVVRLPAGYSFEESATLPCAAVTVWNALVPMGNLQKGETVLAQGTGGVSIFALQIANILGARVIITSSSDEKLERARKLGAWQTINYKKTPNWEEKALELTGGKGVDHVIEVGGQETLPKSIRAARVGGRITMVGLLTGSFGKPDAALTEPKQLRVEGVYVGSTRMFEDMNRVLDQHKVKPIIDRVFPFEQAREAYQHLKSGAHFGKIVISI